MALLCVLLAGIALPAAAQDGARTFAHEASGITFHVPEDMMAQDASGEGFTALVLAYPEEENMAFLYSLSYAEGLAGVWLETLSDGDLQRLAEQVAGNIGRISYDIVEVDGVQYMLVQNEAGDFAVVLTLLNGWVCMLTAVAADGYMLTEDTWAELDRLQRCIEYAG